MDCIIIDDDATARLIVSKLCNKVSSLTVLEEFSNAIEAIKYLNTNEVDVIFLDIHMPTFSGFDFIQTLKNPPKIILTTSDKNFALEAFEYPSVVDYLLKPIQQARFEKAVQKLANFSIQGEETRTAEKKDSQGLCFIGKVRLPEFLQQKLQPKEGRIINIPKDFSQYTKLIPAFKSKESELAYFSTKFSYNEEDGKVLGNHQGAHYFTKGQRKGLNVGGTKEALYVIETNVDTNTIYTGEGKNHQGLYRNVLFVSNEEIHWIREDLTLNVGETLEVEARIRYRQVLEKATLHKVASGLYVAFENKQSAIQEGQFVAWYKNEELLGSGVIS